MQGTADVLHQSAAAPFQRRLRSLTLRQRLTRRWIWSDPQPTLVERLVRHVLLPRELLPQIEINSIFPVSQNGPILLANPQVPKIVPRICHH